MTSTLQSVLNASLAQSNTGGSDIGGVIFLVVYLAIILVCIVGCWKVFEKAGQPGWAILIPFFNIYIMCKIAGRPWWWLLLMLIPFVNFIVGIILAVDIAKSFGKGIGFAVGLIFLPFIFYPILGFGDAQYQGPAHA